MSDQSFRVTAPNITILSVLLRQIDHLQHRAELPRNVSLSVAAYRQLVSEFREDPDIGNGYVLEGPNDIHLHGPDWPDDIPPMGPLGMFRGIQGITDGVWLLIHPDVVVNSEQVFGLN